MQNKVLDRRNCPAVRNGGNLRSLGEVEKSPTVVFTVR